MLRCTNAREPATQVCPAAAKIPASSPALAWAKSASGNTIFADLPPTSRVTCAMRRAARTPTARPASTPPVKAILATPQWSMSASAVSRPPVTTFRTPRGNPICSANLPASMIDAELTSAGLMTTVLPAASAGATALVVRKSGEFHGMMTPTTPPPPPPPQRPPPLIVEYRTPCDRNDPALDLVCQTAIVIKPVGHDARLQYHLG